ncbi:MAG: transglycosylase domain-containing protein [Clostridia bacterium]|nr:transglycosylase domain-containing protein [Clostridia bacterium]
MIYLKIFRRIIIIVSIFILVIASILFFIGYGSYSNVLKEKPLFDRINEITSKEHFVKFDDLNKNYINAVIAIEDHRYFDHGAVDYLSIIRAVFTNLKEGEFEQGGSTITQQVAKNVFFSQERTLSRKLGEVFGASDLEKNYSKNEIFAIYVNTAYFGDGYYGIYDASKGYYNKEPKDLTLYEASMLAGVPNAPSIYAPTVNPELAKQRQKQVLNAMVKYGYISESDKSDVLNQSVSQ